MRTLFLVLCASFFHCCLGLTYMRPEPDYYYWRGYTGVIPIDALEAGEDVNKNPTYIGQAYFPEHYLQVVRIYSGNREVVASHDGLHKTKVYVKILCSVNKERFKWKPVNGKTLHLCTIGERVVVGGEEDGYVLNIGRIMYQGELIVGKVCSYNIGNARLYFPHGNKEKNAIEYEILTYNTTLDDYYLKK